MKDHEAEIEDVRMAFPELSGQRLVKATNGTHHEVYISEKYVIRFGHGDPQSMEREACLLKSLDHPLIPKISWMNTKDFPMIMIERRLPGQTIDLKWRSLTPRQKKRITSEVMEFIGYMRTVRCQSVYSVGSGRSYADFMEFLMGGVRQKLERIQKFDMAASIFNEVATVADECDEISVTFHDGIVFVSTR